MIGRDGRRATGGIEVATYGIAAVLAALWPVTEDPAWVGAGAFVFGGLALWQELRFVRQRGGWSPLASYLLSVLLVGAANTAATIAWRGPMEGAFDFYASRAHAGSGLLTALLEAFAVSGGFIVIRKLTRKRGGAIVWPISGNLTRGELSLALPVVALALSGLAWLDLLPSLGTLTGVLKRLPMLSAFALAYFGATRRESRLQIAGLVVALFDASRAIDTSILRSNMALPLVAFALGTIVGGGLKRRIQRALLVPAAGFGMIFVTYFEAFGAVRRDVGGGLERIAAVRDAHHEGLERGWISLAARVSTINQLSRVHSLADEEGLLHGETLGYLKYALIPRFLWSEKPVSQVGGWFAWKLGLGGVKANGLYSNSINMTVGGELYLNFGWPGVLLGGMALGALLALFWGAGGLRREGYEMATLFSFSLFLFGFGLGADLQIVVTMTATYLIFVAAGRVLTIARESSGAKTRAHTRARPTRNRDRTPGDRDGDLTRVEVRPG